MTKRFFVATLAMLTVFALVAPAAFAAETTQEPGQLESPDGVEQSVEQARCATPNGASSQQALPFTFDAEAAFGDGCTAELTCPSGCYISCAGQSVCTVGSSSVTCDGNTTNCPYPGCTPVASCQDPCGFCDCRAHGGRILQCHKDYCV